MKRKIMILTLLFVLVLSKGIYAQETQEDNTNILEDLTKNVYKQYNVDDLEGFYVENGLDEVLQYSTLEDFIVGIVKGEVDWDLQQLIQTIKNQLFKELALSMNLLARIIFLAVMAAVLNNISTSFGKNEVNNVAFLVVYLVLIGLIGQSFYTCVTIGTTTIDSVINFIQAILPTMFVLLASVGGIASSSMLSPLVLYIVSFIGTVINGMVYPLIIASAVVTLINYISSEVNISNLAKLLKESAIFILGFLFILFLGVISIQGIAMTTLDGVSVKTAKYAVDLIPFVGGFLADSMDTIISASSLIKNAVGVIGLLIIVAIIALPIIKMFAIMVMFKIAAAIIQPISNEKIVKCLSDISNYIWLVMACVIVIAFMFFLIITMIILLGDMTVMYR
ncbi:MAG: stage III sporulation protein AE [Eubacteriales bacterium]